MYVQQGSERGEIGDNDSVESGSGHYRTYTPPPLLDDVAEATGSESIPEGIHCMWFEAAHFSLKMTTLGSVVLCCVALSF